MFAIYMLGSTADEYFSPALSEISDRLKLSPTLAISDLLDKECISLNYPRSYSTSIR